MLKAEHLTCGYGGEPVVKDLSFEVPSGGRLCILRRLRRAVTFGTFKTQTKKPEQGLPRSGFLVPFLRGNKQNVR